MRRIIGKLRSEPPTHGGAGEKPKSTREKLAEKNARLKMLRERLEKKDRELAVLRKRLTEGGTKPESVGIKPENIVWIFGYGRTGSTWLSSMMKEIEAHTVWFEPNVGDLFGHLYYVRSRGGQRRSKHFILGSQRETWLNPLRDFVLEVASARFPEVANEGYLVVKEPFGSIGAPLLMEALPESRMILLIRDPRDTTASALDAFREGSWGFERTHKDHREETLLATEQPDAFVKMRASKYMQYVGNAKQAYENHTGHKVLIKYEDLRHDTLQTMKRIYSTLEMPVKREELAQAVEKNSWEKIPEEKKGEGKFYRRASSGGWREDLTEKQIAIIEEITSPIIDEFYQAG
jgi:hypothetical protein